MLTSMHQTPVEGNFEDEYGKAIKPPLLKVTMCTWGMQTGLIE